MPDLPQEHEYFVAIDSDGCVFDTMEVKWKECFIPQVILHYKLQGVSKFARECLEFVNLYSKTRGCNRFLGLAGALDLLKQRPEVAARGFADRCEVPPSLRQWIETETKLGEPALQVRVEETNDPDLQQALTWSQAVNQSIGEMVHDVPPFPMVRESLQRFSQSADAIVCSATPTAALQKEWAEHRIEPFVQAIFGQEAGNKKQILARAADYPAGKRLMIGDAPGDFQAARASDCLFYPINPGREEASWHRLHEEAIDKFFAGTFAGEYQQQILDEFDTYLPEHPPWQAGK